MTWMHDPVGDAVIVGELLLLIVEVIVGRVRF
jgi:hypothetical protein